MPKCLQKSVLSATVTALLMLLPLYLHAEYAAAAEPLFASDEPLEITIALPVHTITRERSDEEEVDGSVSWLDGDGNRVATDVKIRARGNYRRRRDTCPFPPLRLNFKTSELVGTPFEGQDKLKLVTHCRDGSSRYQQAVHREYVTYKFFNALTDRSYRVRQLRITYTDTEGSDDDQTAYGFVIEHRDHFTKRTGLPFVEVPRTTLDALDSEFTNLTSVFQLMIGNTDFSPIAGAEGESCCHNVHLYGGEEGPLYPIPYDFDMSGMIDAPYASPNPRFNLRNVRQRLYRGRCVNNALLPDTFRRFQDNRARFYELVAGDPQLDKGSKRNMTKYLDSFFKLIDSPKTVERKIVAACLGSSS